MSVATTVHAAPAGDHTGPVAPLPAAPVTDVDGRPVLRLLPAPPCEPPYDDELPPDRPVGRSAAAPASHVVLRLVPQRPTVPALPQDLDDDEHRRTPLAQLPAPRPFAQALVQRLLEVQAGLRPLSQLQRDTSFELFTELEQTLPRRHRQPGPRPTRRDVRSVHVQARPDGVAEVCATVHRSGRAQAMALRLEGVDGAWRCTALLGV